MLLLVLFIEMYYYVVYNGSKAWDEILFYQDFLMYLLEWYAS